MTYTLAVLVAAAGILTASPVLAELQKCVGPDGDVIFVNTTCPDGYTVEASRPESQPSPPDATPPPEKVSAPSGEIPASSDTPSAPSEEPVKRGQAACLEGEFEFKEGSIFFTNSRREGCKGMKAVCTFDIRQSQRVVSNDRRRPADRRRGDEYVTSTSQLERTFNFTGQVGKFGTEKIGDANISGRVTGWSCRALD